MLRHEPLLRQTLTIMRQTFGDKPPHTLSSCNNLAVVSREPRASFQKPSVVEDLMDVPPFSKANAYGSSMLTLIPSFLISFRLRIVGQNAN